MKENERMIKSNIGKYLELAGITQRELAERVGTTEVSISRYASGERIPKATTCIKIAKVLNCRAEDLFYEEWSDMAVSITENEAIIELQSYMPKDNGLNDKDIEAFNMAIHALSEIQQYRAIGTVEGYELAINESIDKHNLMIVYKDRLKEFEAIGTIEEFKALKEKNEPKKDNNDDGRCKSCGTYNNFIISRLANPKGHPVIHCWNCGQAIDWQ